MNGKTSLTQVQRHHNVDSVTLAGVLSSWWENEEHPGKKNKTNKTINASFIDEQYRRSTKK
jgi:transcriptional activator SPT8